MNKNSRRIQAKKRVARRAGQKSVVVQVPVSNYHSNSGLTNKTLEVSGGSGVISRNERRNMQMRVLTNAGGGANASLTTHEKIRDKEPANPKPRMDNNEKAKRGGRKE